MPTITVGDYTGVEPTEIDFSGDMGNIVNDLTWSVWDATGATGQGISPDNNCDPDCGHGTVTDYPASITLAEPVAGQFTVLIETRYGPAGTQPGFITFTLPDPLSGGAE